MFGPALLYWYHFSKSGLKITTTTDISDTVAVNFLKLYNLSSEVDPLQARTFDISLILYAEHDFNASTFAARCTVSTMSDFYSGITSAIGTLRGPLHGGANEAAMRLLEPIRSVKESNEILEGMWQKKQLVMGFGHRIYKKEDPRSEIIKQCSIELSRQKYGKPLLVEVSQNIEKRMISEKNIYPNLDFYAASAYNQCGIITYLHSNPEISSRPSSSFPAPRAGPPTSSSNARPRRSSGPSRVTWGLNSKSSSPSLRGPSCEAQTPKPMTQRPASMTQRPASLAQRPKP